jgi:hypothetical protein
LWVANGILLLRVGCAAAVLEVIRSVIPHEGILYVPKVYPNMRELMSEKRVGVKIFVSVKRFRIIDEKNDETLKVVEKN